MLAKNFGVDEQAFANIPRKELYIFPASLPAPISVDLAASRNPVVPEPLNYVPSAQAPLEFPKGRVRIVDSNTFKASKTIAVAIVEVDPGGMRELHWHPNADEWQYFISGRARETVFPGGGRAHTEDFEPGDVGYVKISSGHYIENIGPDTLKFLEIFKSDHYADVSLAQWMANSPRELVEAHLSLPPGFLDRIPQTKQPIAPLSAASRRRWVGVSRQ